MHSVRNLTYLSLMSVIMLMLSACTPALEPAKPDDSGKSHAQEQAQNSQKNTVFNPLERGMRKVWETKLTTPPLAVTFNAEKNEIVVLTEREKKQMLIGFARVGDDSESLIKKWTFVVPHGEVQNLVTRNENIYFNTVDKISEGANVDLYALQMRDGSEKFRWSKLHPFDLNAPQIVGSYLRGLGVAKIDKQRVVAAILDDMGKVTASEKFFNNADARIQKSTAKNFSEAELKETGTAGVAGTVGNSATQIYQFRQNQVVLPIQENEKTHRIIAFPMLKMISGDWCEVAGANSVCVERVAKKVVKYDLSGDVEEMRELKQNDPAMKYRFIGGVPNMRVNQLFAALAPKAETGVEAENSKNQDAGTEMSLVPLQNSFLYGSNWIPQNKWKGLRDPQSCVVANRQAPFCLEKGELVNVRTGERVSEKSARIFLGTGAARQTFFKYENGVLSMLGEISADKSGKENK